VLAFAFRVAVDAFIGLVTQLGWRSGSDSSGSGWFAAGLEEAAREHGIRFAPRSWWRMTATGLCQDLSVQVELRQAQAPELGNQYRPHVCVAVSGPRIPRLLAFAPERGTGDDVLTGDVAFDDIVEVRGEPSILLALLDRELRQRVGEFVGLDGRLREGRLTCCARTDFSRGDVPRALRLAIWLARALSSPEGGGICERLARNATSDPHSGVRLWNLLQLHEQFPDTPEAREASRVNLGDPGPWVRLAAARFSREEGLDALKSLAEDREAPEGAAAEAVALFAARGPAEAAGPLLLAALKTRTGQVRRQAIEDLGRLRHLPARGPLLVLLERADPRTAAAAAAALAALGDARAEPGLLAAVESEARELRLAALRALATLGSVASVEPLLAFLETRHPDTETRREVRAAVDAIQSRLAGAEAGQLSLAVTPAGSGWLSVAPPGAGPGAVSLLPDREPEG